MLSQLNFVFNHFPKTGGVSLLKVCRENLLPDEISPTLVDHDLRQKSPSSFEHYRLINGHFSVLTQMAFSLERYRITLLRHPVKRIYSAYTFYRMMAEQNVLTVKAKELSFSAFVHYFQDSPQVIHDTYTHHLAAIGRDCSRYPNDMGEVLAIAKHNLCLFDFVGILEELEGSIRLLCRELGWPSPMAVPFENRTRSGDSFDRIDARTMRLLLERNQNDLELYEFAVRLFCERSRKAPEKSETKQTARSRRAFVRSQMSSSVESRRATIFSVSTAWLPVDHSNCLEIAVCFKSSVKVPKLGLGLMVTDESGNIVWGANTSVEGLQLEMAAGYETRAAFLLRCELPEGEYFVTAALSELRRLGFHEHWIDRAAVFSGKKNSSGSQPRQQSVQPLSFWSAVAHEASADQPPWRNESDLEGTTSDWRLRGEFAGPTRSSALTADASSAAVPKFNFRARAYLNSDAQIADPRVRIRLLDDRVEYLSKHGWRLRIEITNLGEETLSSRYARPVNLSYHWLSDTQTMLQRDGLRSTLSFDILPGSSLATDVLVGPPTDESASLLCLTLVQEMVCWFDDRHPDNRLLVRIADGLASAA